MNMIGLGLAEIVLLGMLGGSLGLGMPTSIPPLPEDPLLAKVAPAECLAYVTWSGTVTIDPSSANSTEKLLNEPQIRKFLKEIESRINQSMQASAQPGPAGLEPFAILQSIMNRPGAAYLAKLKLDPMGPTDLEAALILQTGDDGPKIEALFKQLFAAAGPIEPVQIGTRTFQRIAAQPNQPAITFGVRGKYFILGTGEGIIESIEQRARQEAPKWLTDLRQRLAVPRISGISYVNLSKIIPIVMEAAGPGAVLARGIMSSLGLDMITSFTSVTGLDEKGFVNRSELAVGGIPIGLLGFLDMPSLTENDLQLIPEKSPVATMIRIDYGKIYDWAMSQWGQFAPLEKQNYDAALGRMETQLNLNLRRDIIGSLGDSLRIVAEPGGGTELINGWTITVPVKDRQRFSQVYEQLMQLLGVLSTQGQVPPIKQSALGKYKAYSITLPAPELPIAPTWCLTEKELILSMSSQSLQTAANRTTANPSLAKRADVAERLKNGPPMLMAVSMDMRAILQAMMPLVEAGLQQAMAQGALPGNEPFQLPPIEVLTKHLEPSLIAMMRTKSGVELYSRQTFPGGNLGSSMPTTLALLLPAVQSARHAAQRTQSMNNLKLILLAMHNFHDAYEGFPAAYSLTKDGKPGLSWRVHLLPYIDQDQLYRQFHLDEPWDSEHNKKLIASMPMTYRSPLSTAEPGRTNYLGVSGEKGIIAKPEGDKAKEHPVGLPLSKVTDGTSNTIAVVEASDPSAVIWTKPDDYEPDPNDPLKGLVGLHAQQGFLAVLADGSVRFISSAVNADVLRALMTRNGGEAVRAP